MLRLIKISIVCCFSIDYLRLIGERIGIDIRFEGSIWDEALKKALNHDVDGIINAAIKEDRKPYLNFTSPYFNTSLALITRKEFEPISDLNEFCVKSIAIIKGSIRTEIVGSAGLSSAISMEKPPVWLVFIRILHTGRDWKLNVRI